MQPNSEQSIAWFTDRIGKVVYSMVNRRGEGNPPGFDCSSAQYMSLIQGKYLPAGIYIGNTNTLFDDLERNGWVQLQPNAQGNYDTQRNDIFIWGVRGQSAGADGHTGRFLDANNVIHCSYAYNGIHENNYDALHAANGWPVATYYRYVGGTPPQLVNSPTDQVIEVGSFIRFDKVFRVDDVQDIADLWQVRTDELCPVGFTWADNGIPAAPLVEIDVNGYATPDQSLDVGSRYIIPGKFEVAEVGQSGGRWLAKIGWADTTFWVDLEPATEVASDDPGTPTPPQAPQPPVIATTTTTTEVPQSDTTTTTEAVVPPTTDTTTTTVREETTTTTLATEPVATTTTTTVAEVDTTSIDLEKDGGTFSSQEFATDFWAQFWLGFEKVLKAIWNRLRGIS